MATKRMSAWEARRNFGKLLNEVTRNDRPVVIESHGEAVAAMVPIHVLDNLESEREHFFETMQQASERANLSEEEAMELAIQEIAEYRAEQRVKSQR